MNNLKTATVVLALALFCGGQALAEENLIPDGVIYEVKPGDTLETIAETFLGKDRTGREIAAATAAARAQYPDLADEKMLENLQPGQKLLLPVKLTTRKISEFLVADQLDFPEAPFYSKKEDLLYYVEWGGDRIWKYKDGQKILFMENAKDDGPCGLDQDKDGNLWVALYSSGKMALYSPEGKQLKLFEEGPEGRFVGPNDLVVDKSGGAFFTDSGNFEDDWVSGREAGKVYYITPDDRILLLDKGISYANGIVLSPAGDKLYVNEHRKNRILVYDVDGEKIGNRRVLIDLDNKCLSAADVCYEVGPDGMTRDGVGNLWVAHYHTGRMLKISPEGRVLQNLYLPLGDTPTNATLSPDEKFIYVSEASTGSLLKLPVE